MHEQSERRSGDLRELNCRSCGAPLDPANIVERLAMARCGHCGSVFALHDMRGLEAATAEVLRPDVPMPRGIEINNYGDVLQISRRWFSFVFIFLAGFCVFWNGFMIVWHTISIASGAWFMSVFGLIHTAVGIGLLYFTLAGFLNTTVIRAGAGLMEIKHGPIPWFGNKSIGTDDFRQLYCQERVHHGKNGVNYTYEVHVIKQNNVRETLLKGLNQADQALYIEQELERFLRIEDQSVRGELPR